MSYSVKDFEFLGKQVAAGRYVARTTFILSVVLALFLGGIIGYVCAPKGSSAQGEELQRPVGAGTSSFTGNMNQQIVASILQHEEDVRKDPTNAEAWEHLGNLYYDNNEPQKSINSYLKHLELSPKNTSAIVDCGIMFRSIKDYETAITYFNRALLIDPKHEFAMLNKGVVLYYDLERKTEGLETWRKLLAQNPKLKMANGTSLADMVKELEGQ